MNDIDSDENFSTFSFEIFTQAVQSARCRMDHLEVRWHVFIFQWFRAIYLFYFNNLSTKQNLDKLTKYQLRIFINQLLKSCPLLVTRMLRSCIRILHGDGTIVRICVCCISNVDKGTCDWWSWIPISRRAQFFLIRWLRTYWIHLWWDLFRIYKSSVCTGAILTWWRNIRGGGFRNLVPLNKSAILHLCSIFILLETLRFRNTRRRQMALVIKWWHPARPRVTRTAVLEDDGLQTCAFHE